MSEEITDADIIKDSDIVFDCPHCGKSLAIDYRGAGLTIPCSDCGKQVQVPIPDGMELIDIDSSEEEQELRIIHLRNSLANAESRISELENQLEEVTERRKYLEGARTHNMSCFKVIKEKTNVIQQALSEISNAVNEIFQDKDESEAG